LIKPVDPLKLSALLENAAVRMAATG